MKSYEHDSTAAALNALAKDINQWAEKKGFQALPNELQELCDKSAKVNAYITLLVKSQKIALIHSEASEELEGIRKPTESGLSGFTNEEEETADIIIRALNYAGQFGLRIGEALCAKMAKNEDRPFRHGKEF